MPGTEFGELQLAIWARQFQALRDGDRFFYGNDPGLSLIMSRYGIDYHRTLGQVIAANTDIPASDLNDNVFLVKDDDLPAATCSVTYHIDSTWTGEYQVSLAIRNLTNSRINGWTVGWQFPGGQTLRTVWNSVASQRGSSVSLSNPGWNPSIPPGGTVTDAGFIAGWDNTTNSIPTNITLNNRRCARE